MVRYFVIGAMVLGVILGLSFPRPVMVSELVVPDVSCACDPKIKDVYERPARMNFGSLTGQCVETCRFRRADLLKWENGRQTVTNFMHDKKYWTASIPVDKVTDIDVSYEKFFPGVYHVYLRFHFADGEKIWLTEQGVPASQARKMEVEGMTISPEAVPPRGTKYDIVQSAFNNYLFAYRLVSVKDMADWAKQEKHTVKQFRLTMPSDKKVETLRSGLHASQYRSMSSVYSLLLNNCASAVSDLVDAEAMPAIASALPVDLPFFSMYFELKGRGFIEANSAPLPNLEVEFQN